MFNFRTIFLIIKYLYAKFGSTSNYILVIIANQTGQILDNLLIIIVGLFR